jgi:hypothetical protein
MEELAEPMKELADAIKELAEPMEELAELPSASVPKMLHDLC